MKQSAITPLSLGSDKISSLLARYAIPAIIAMTSSSLYNIIDSIFIGHGVGAMAISGMALTMPLMNLSSAFGAMVGVGAAAIISIRLGEGNRAAAEKTLGNVVLLNLLVGLLMMAVSILFLDPILYFFGASEQTISYARDFMQIILAGSVFTHMYLGLNEVLRASGYPKKAMMIMLVAVVVNCALNPLFIFVFGWGIRGSALATIIAQVVALSISIGHFANPESFLHFKRGIFRLRKRIVSGILSIGAAPFLLHLCASVVVIFVNKALQNNGGDLYIGAYGVINRVVMLFVMVVSGLNQGMQPIVGYNYGSKQYDRVVKSLFITYALATGVTTLAFLMGQFMPRQIAMLFVGSGDANAEQLIEAAAHGLRLVVSLFPLVGFQIVTSNFFQYIGKPKRAILLSMTRQMLFLVPMLLLLPPYLGTDGVWLAMPIADGCAVVLALLLILPQIRWFRRESRRMELER